MKKLLIGILLSLSLFFPIFNQSSVRATITAETPRVSWTGNGANTTFTYPFRIFNDTELLVYVDDLLQIRNVYYTVTMNPGGVGGEIVFAAAYIPALNTRVDLVRNIPLTQTIDLREGDRFPAETFEASLDKQTMILQDIDSKVGMLETELGLTTLDPDIVAGMLTGKDVKLGGPWIDARVYNTLELANTAAYNAGKALLISSNWTLTANTVLTASVMRIPGGSFTKASTYTLHFSGKFVNPDNGQAFIGFDPGDVTFGNGSILGTHPEWWATNTTPGTTEMYTALQCALTATGGKFPLLLSNIYLSTGALAYNTTVTGKLNIEGTGTNAVIRVGGTTNKCIVVTGAQGGGHDFVYMRDFRIEDYNSTGSAALIHIYGVAGLGLQRLNIDGKTKASIGFLLNGSGTAGTQQGEISNCSIFSNGIGLQTDAGGANGIEVHGCTFAGNSIGDVYYNTNSAGAATFEFHHNHLVYDNVAAVAIRLGANCSVKPSFHSNHIEGSYAKIFQVENGKLEAAFNKIIGGGIGVTSAFSIEGGSYHDIFKNHIHGADVVLANYGPINYVFNSVYDSDESSTCTTLNAFGNKHFGTGTVTMPYNYLVSDQAAAGNLMTLKSPAVSGAWGMLVQGAGTAEDVYLQLGTAKLKGRSDAETYLRTSGDLYPDTDNSYYLGKNNDDTPLAWKGVILKDTTNGTYYRIEIINGVITATSLTD